MDRMFRQWLAEAILMAGSTAELSVEAARVMADEVCTELMDLGTDAFPCLVQRDDLRFVYQWDEEPPVLTVMLWDEGIWRDVAQSEVPDLDTPSEKV